MAHKCGAKNRRGKRCGMSKMPNGRCRFHGGMSTGPKRYNAGKNAIKHGIYCRHFTDEERERSKSVPLNSVDELIFATQTMLDRAIGAYARQKKIEADATLESAVKKGGIEIVEIIERPGLVGFGAPKEIKAKLQDFLSVIDRLTARLESLKRTRAELIKAAIDEDDAEDTTPIRKLIVEIVEGKPRPASAEVVNANNAHDHDSAAG